MRTKAALFPAWRPTRPDVGSVARKAGTALLLRLLDEQERWPLWMPVFLGCGVGLYFALPSEPPAWLAPVLLAAALAMLVAGVLLRHRAAGWLLLVAAMATGGVAAAQARTLAVAAPVVPYAGTFAVEGTVVEMEPRRKGSRVLLDDLAVERLAPDATPRRVRVALRWDEGVRPGARIALKARLSPPSPPALPGGYDFARKAFFEGLGGIGFALGRPVVVAPAPEGANRLERLRLHLTEAMRREIPGVDGAVAAALTTGLRADIPDGVWEDMQRSGLAHLLAISGLHMTLVAGAVFILVRYLLALCPPLALRATVKKLAAAVALVAAFAYLLVSGASIPAQRAFIMTGVALVAVMLDRSPLSMRLVALAALVVLVSQPESLTGPSFQMSFAAVVALIAWYERRPERREGTERQRHHLLVYLAGITATTLLASLATAPFSAWHFQRVAVLGVVANLIGVPLTGFWIMPSALMAFLLMPFGLEAPFFWLMGEGIGWLLWIASLIADMPYAALDAPFMPFAALLFMAAGGLWLCLWLQPWRRFGLVPVACGLVLLAFTERPLLLVDAEMGHAAVVGDEGVRLLALRKDAFLEDLWLRALGGDPLPWPGAPPPNGPLRCDPWGCILDHGERRIALAFRAGALAEDCGRVDLVVAFIDASACSSPRPVVDRPALRDMGGAAVYATTDGFEIRPVQAARGERPWTRR
ncbi:MAG: ComEC/Rec2 family competence protein [Geminicoccaceae bacterium]|nr:ComEC/Rec2 family competence protein [Geminicoccaceae bacterium]